MKKLFLLLLAVAIIAPSAAQAGFGFGVRGGIASADDFDDNMPHVGADFRFGLVMVELIVSAEYSWKKYELMSEELTMHHFAGTGSLVYPIKLPVVTPYVGGGFGSHTFVFNYGDATSIDDLTETKMGYHFLGGVKIGGPGIPVKLYGEYRHYWINFDGGTAKTYTLSGGIIFGI